MLLQLEHPGLAKLDCRTCWAYHIDETTWTVRKHGITGQPIRRVGGPPCTLDCGCPKGTIGAQRSLRPKNARALRHWYECRATGQWPDDGLVRQRAGLLQQIQDQRDTGSQRAMLAFVQAMASSTHGPPRAT